MKWMKIALLFGGVTISACKKDSTRTVDSAGGEADTASMAGMDHSKMGHDSTGASAPAGDSAARAGMDHSQMAAAPGTTSPAAPMAGMDHSNMPGMSGSSARTAPATPSMEGMDHSKMPGMTGSAGRKAPTGSSMAGMDHSPMQMPAASRTPSRQPANAMAGMDHSRMNMGGTTPRTTAPMAGMAHSAMASSQPATGAAAIPELGASPADVKLQRIVSLLTRDSIVMRRIQADPALRATWEKPEVRRLIVNDPGGE